MILFNSDLNEEKEINRDLGLVVLLNIWKYMKTYFSLKIIMYEESIQTHY